MRSDEEASDGDEPAPRRERPLRRASSCSSSKLAGELFKCVHVAADHLSGAFGAAMIQAAPVADFESLVSVLNAMSATGFAVVTALSYVHLGWDAKGSFFTIEDLPLNACLFNTTGNTRIRAGAEKDLGARPTPGKCAWSALS